jgi:hypothetical protein
MGVADDPNRETVAGWPSRPALTIPEELMLVQQGVWGRIGKAHREILGLFLAKEMAAGSLIELVLERRVTIGSVGRYLLRRGDAILVADAAPTGDALLDDDLRRIAGSKTRSYGYWIDHPAKGTEAAYWDRLVERSLIRPDDLSDAPTYVADANAVAATTEQIRAVLAGPETADLRAIALVSLLAHGKRLGALLHQTKRTPAGLARGHLARRREEKRGRQAIENYKRFVESAPELDEDERNWAVAAANSIELIALHTTPDGWFEGGG